MLGMKPSRTQRRSPVRPELGGVGRYLLNRVEHTAGNRELAELALRASLGQLVLTGIYGLMTIE